jgi:hypothetical protein
LQATMLGEEVTEGSLFRTKWYETRWWKKFLEIIWCGREWWECSFVATWVGEEVMKSFWYG